MNDLAPTLLTLLSLPSPATFQGRSFWNDLDRDRSDEHLLSELPAFGRRLSLQTGRHKVMVRGPKGNNVAWYDLEADPQETQNLVDRSTDPRPYQRLRAALDQQVRDNAAVAERLNRQNLTTRVGELTVEQLRALGYVE